MKKILLSLLVASGLATAGDITVSAAASLTDAFNDIVKSYEGQHREAKIKVNYAGSGALLQQIRNGAPVDVFASADLATMDKAADLIDPASRKDFAANKLVVIVPAAKEWQGKDVAALINDKKLKRIAIAQPDSVPVGRYTKKVLEKAGLWDKLGDRHIPTQHVRQSLDYVARGEVDAGFVYATDAALRSDKVKVVLEVSLDEPLHYPIAVLKASKDAKEAQRFVDFVLGEEGQKILQNYGFSPAR